jgi:hypothetical protein
MSKRALILWGSKELKRSELAASRKTVAMSSAGYRFVIDHSCCRQWPAFPTPARDRIVVQRFEEKAFLSLSKTSSHKVISEHLHMVYCADSAPWPPSRSLSCVLLI